MNSFKKSKGSRPDCTGRSEVFFRKVTIPATFGDELTGTMKPENGAYNNALVFYEASGVSFLYDSDGVYTKIANIEGETAGVISINGKQGVVTITLAELGGMTESQINALIASKGYQTASQIDVKIANAKAQIEREIPTKVSELSNDSGYQNASQVDSKIATAKTQIEAEIPDVIDNVTSTSADNALSAKQGKLLNDRITNLDSRGRYLSTWNATTGEPGTEPEVLPYSYRTGDYFIVATVGTTNYRPTGTQYTGTASTVVETDTVSPNDTYLYDGTTWELIHTEIPQIAVDENLSTTSRNPVENRTITGAINDIEEDLDGKQDTLTAGDNITIEDNTISAVIPEKPYVSLERNGEYLYTVTFDTLPEETTPTNTPAGACTSFVRDGKLYRNLDWYYNENVSFRVVTKDFEGMSFASGLTSTTLDDEKIAQLPYQIVDGVNRHGIMVSTHVLYNDWGATGTGTIPLTKLPFIVLSQVSSMATLETELGDTLSNMYVPQAMVDAEYLIQVLVTDGTTTYVLRPGSAPDQSYEAIDITSNPKLTNFRWVDQTTVVRNGNYMQNRPTGVERWNEIDSDVTLEDLRFTKAYEASTRLSEFIGIDDTDKDSTDAELTAIYDLAHAEYLIRQRDGKLWQTMHSVVYGTNGIERLYVQEDWNKDYAYATREYVDEAVEAVEGEIPELLGSTGQSTTAGMTQKAITDALAGAGGGVKVLTEDDYNWPATGTKTAVALWLLEPGIYTNGDAIGVRASAGDSFTNKANLFIVGEKAADNSVGILVYVPDNLNESKLFLTNSSTGAMIDNARSAVKIVDSLYSTSANTALSGRQGKVLKDLIDSLIIKGSGAPTTSTVGTVGKLYEDTTNGKLYQCTAVSGSTYTWETVGGGGGGPTVVQTIGTSTTDVMSQKAASDMVYLNGATDKIVIGQNARNSNNWTGNIAIGLGAQAWNGYSGTIAIGESAIAGYSSATNGSVAIGRNATANASWSVAVGGQSQATVQGEFSVGSGTGTDLYNSTGYRKITNVYDGENAHDAATYGQIISYSAITGTSAPTTSTVAKYIGQTYTDTTTGKYYRATAIDTTTPEYTWEEIGSGGGSGPTVVQTTGTSTTDVMSQKAVTDELYYRTTVYDNVKIGTDAVARENYTTAVGYSAKTNSARCSAFGNTAQALGYGSSAFGYTSKAEGQGAVAIGNTSNATQRGQFDIGCTDTYYGYDATNYRLLTGVHDGINAHDAATLAQGNTLASTAPTTSTVGVVGQLYTDTSTGKLYHCTAVSGSTYTWSEVGGGGGGGVNVVQTTGTSTTDVMSQAAVTEMVFVDKTTRQRVQIGANAVSGDSRAIAIGDGATASGIDSTAIGNNASYRTTASGSASLAAGYNSSASAQNSVAIGAKSSASVKGEFSIGGSGLGTNGYNNTSYRLLTNVHDPVNDHDAATKKYVDDHSGGGGELAHKLTTADYNYPASNPNSIALWLLEPGVYWSDTNDSVDIRWVNGSAFELNTQFYTTYIVGGKYGINKTIVSLSSESTGSNQAGWIYNVNPSNGNVTNSQRILWSVSTQDNLTSTNTWRPLSANQGRVLDEKIQALEARIAALEGNA